MRGILGTKIGMTQIFDDENRIVPVTVVKVAGCRVGQVKTRDNDGYAAVQLCLGQKRNNKITKAAAGHARAAGGIDAPRHIVELDTDDGDEYASGLAIPASVFEAGDIVDVIGVSKGKGHAGVMKRHNFAGLKASHGTHRVHRHGGSIGMAATPGRVQKGMGMSGQLGHARTTIQNLTVVETDTDRDLILIKGALPGPNGGLVMVTDAVKSGSKAFVPPEPPEPPEPKAEESPDQEPADEAADNPVDEAEDGDES